MKIHKIATASLLPAAFGGLALSVGVAVTAQAAPTQHAASAAAGRSYSAGMETVQRDALAAVKLAAQAADQAAAQAAAHARAEAAAHARAAAAANARAAAAAQAQQAAVSQQPLTAGMSAFEQCVAWRESSNTPTDPAGLFGILPSTWASLGYSGTAGQASVAQQKVAFNRLYAQYGTQPWAPFDGC